MTTLEQLQQAKREFEVGTKTGCHSARKSRWSERYSGITPTRRRRTGSLVRKAAGLFGGKPARTGMLRISSEPQRL